MRCSQGTAPPSWSLASFALPAFALALAGIGQAARLTRANMVETYGKPYIEMARAYGFPERRIASRYAFRPSLIPSLTIFGLDFAALLGNAFLVESVFAWPGLSRYGVAVILRKDLERDRRHGPRHIGDVSRREHDRRSPDRGDRSAHPPVAEGCMRRELALASRQPAVALGLILVSLVVLSAVFADLITPFPSTSARSAISRNSTAAASALHVRHRSRRARLLHPHRLRLSPFADHGRRRARRSRRRSASSSASSPAISAADGICADALHRRVPLDPAAGAGDVDHGLSRADADQRHARRHRDVVALVHAARLQRDPIGGAGRLCARRRGGRRVDDRISCSAKSCRIACRRSSPR